MQEADTVGRINDQLAARAAGWHARLRAPDCSAAERSEFDAWMAASEQNRLAFEAASRAARRVSEALRLDPRLRAMLEDDDVSLVSNLRARDRSVARRRVAMAASLLAATGLAAISAVSLLGHGSPPQALARYENVESHQKTVTMQDGSIVHLDAGSLFTAQLLGDSRRISLLKGRAYFEVAHDAARPFSVDAAGTRTLALGTKFEVDVQSEGVLVTLAEGSVAVTPTRSEGQWRRTLAPGQQFVLDATTPTGRLRQVDPASVTAWSRGRLVFDGEPLSSVLAQVNRYSAIKVVLGDERLASIPIGGTFAAGADAGAFVQALSAILPLRSEPSRDDEIVLYPREHSAATR